MGSTDSNTEGNALLHDRERDFLAVLQSCGSVHSVAQSSGVSPRVASCAIRSFRIILSSNDAAVDDFLSLVENWNADGLEGFLLCDSISPDDDYVRELSGNSQGDVANQSGDLGRNKQNAIDEIERDWSPDEMRNLGASLLRLADALDQNWNPDAIQFSFHWTSAARQIEKNALELAKKATLIKRQLIMRKKYLPDAVLGEPEWNMLLELFCQFAGGASVSTKSLCIAAECPESTALRYIDRLEEVGLIRRFKSRADGRVTLAELTKSGVVGVGRVLERISV